MLLFIYLILFGATFPYLPVERRRKNYVSSKYTVCTSQTTSVKKGEGMKDSNFLVVIALYPVQCFM